MQVDKYITDQSQFQNTGVAQVELTASGLPAMSGVDVILVTDFSNSMARPVVDANNDGKIDDNDCPTDFTQTKMYDLVQERVSTIPEDQRERAFFLYQYSDTNLQTSGKLFFGQWWADAIGVKNVAEELSTDNSVAVNMEQIYAWNPSLIFITNFTTADENALYHNTVGTYNWSVVDAVENQRVYKMPLGMYRSYTPGVDTPVTLLWLAKTAYPHLFEDIDIIQETKTYYQEVFGITLTDDQAASIFTPTAQAGSGF